MDRPPKVLFYGNSLVLAGVQATFKGHAGFDVIALETPASERELLACEPSVVVFDLGADLRLAPMQALPGVLLIGVDPESHAVLLSGPAACALSLAQLTQLVREVLAARGVPPAAPPPQTRRSGPSSG